MNIKIPTPEKMQKYPWATTTVSLFAVCIFLLYILVNRPGCENDKWYKAYQEERERNNQLTTSLLVNKGVIEKLKAIKDTTSKTIKNENNN